MTPHRLFWAIGDKIDEIVTLRMDVPIKLYKYVGSEEIEQSVANCASGTVINSIASLNDWIYDTFDRKTISTNLLIATFIIDTNMDLRLADRHSEHVACAAGHPVLSAGEIFISCDRAHFEVCEITNQSTGYCPEIESWQYVEVALAKIPIDRPSCFTTEFTFRSCCDCGQINIIKNGLFICAVCNSKLASEWNL